jgi:DNA topoisomerase-1
MESRRWLFHRLRRNALPSELVTINRAEAKEAGLVYVSDELPGIRRIRRGGGFTYVEANGSRLTDEKTFRRIKQIVVPPAWTDVWVSPTPNGHIQATGRDARRRKQYRYHPSFQATRERDKYEHLTDFAAALPGIRRRVGEDMRKRGLSRERVLATVVYLLDITLIRVGNREYARKNGSFGLTTLRDRHVVAGANGLQFEFEGKSGKRWRLKVSDRRVARIVKACQDLPGQHLFQYLSDTGDRQSVSSTDVNAYLREISGRDITAKDFRTWGGTVLAALALRTFEECDSEATAKANIREAIGYVAKRLGNTPAICRKCYVHPAILDGYLRGKLALRAGTNGKRGLKPEEAAVLSFLRASLRTSVRKAA